MTTADRNPLLEFSPATRAWFEQTFAAPTAAQAQGWSAIGRGEHTLILAPTGSGKTLAAFLWCLDQLGTEVPPQNPKKRCRVLYVSPLKALAHDVERNLKAPLVGIGLAAQRLGLKAPDIQVAIRTGDTPADTRRDIQRTPPDVLITTPESLYLLLTSRAAEILTSVRWVIVDEIHSVAGTKRGAHLALSLERLERVTEQPLQRIGLSATQRPLDEIGRFLGGADRQVTLVDVGRRKQLDLEVVVPIEDMANPGLEESGPTPGGSVLGESVRAEARNSIWPSIYPRLLELIKANRSTLIFVNSRRLAERLAQRLNELWEAEQADPNGGPPLVRAHHGSISREQRLLVEEMLKAGTLRGLVATSSLELGIDMGAIDLVIQVEAPVSVASGLQRIGRAGHTVDAVSVGKIFPKYRGDLLEAAVVVRRMVDGAIESTRVPRNPLDVLAQQIVAMCAQQPWPVDELYATCRRAYNFASLPRSLFEGVLDMLSGHYPSDEFSNLKARLIWDRVADSVVARSDARVVAVTSGGTIPERGLYGVFLGVGGPRVGELDEEMVYESRPGETFVLGASTWRIEQITPQQVIVSPAPGEPGKTPFWHGDAAGRPIELGRALGEFSRRMASIEEERAVESLRAEHSLDELAARNLVAYLAEQKQTTGTIPSDRTVVVERFRDELGDWRVCILTPFGGRVHAPWALAIGAAVRERLGTNLYAIWTDDGIAIRLPEGLENTALDELLFPDAERVEDMVVRELGGSAMFAAHFRENAARALLLPRRRGDARTPLWQMRQRAADLMAVASRYGSFPILLETYRECLQDVFDLPALQDVLRGIEQRRIRLSSVETASASPFARSLLFDYLAEFMYEGDAPLAERRAQALALDRERLRELLGQEELRELLDPTAVGQLELELQSLAERKARNPDQLHDVLRRLGDLSAAEVDARSASEREGGTAEWLAQLVATRRAGSVRIAGEERWIAVEDVARYRDAVGVQPPRGVPDVFLGATTNALESLLLRWARTHAPFTAREPAARWGLPQALVHDTLRRLEAENSVLGGEFRPGGVEREWCDPDVLRSLRRRSLARLRREVEPVPAAALARFLPAWHGLGSEAGSADRLLEVVSQLEGAFLPWSIYERDVLPARVRGYQTRLLDELCASGELVWLGRGSIGTDDGRVALFRREQLALLAPTAPEDPPDEPIHERIREHLAARGASFFREIFSAAGGPTDAAVLSALWDLVWSSEVTNDTLSPLRLRAQRRAKTRRPTPLTRSGPPEAAGRWSLVPRGVASTDRAHALAVTLLERHGVVARESVLGEGVAGGFAAVYPVLKAMEEAGRVRRGYFVEGLGAAQFALPGAVDRLRAERTPPEAPIVQVLAAADPANPYGATLAWPKGRRERLPRVSGAHLVSVDGEPALYVERGSKRLLTLPAFESALPDALGALRRLAENAPRRELAIEQIDGEPVLSSPLRTALEQAGFQREYLGLTLRLPPLNVAHTQARSA